MAQLVSRPVSPVCPRSSSDICGGLRRTCAWVTRVLAVSRRRLALYRLDDAALSDLGLSRADAWQEADKPFWEQPAEEGPRRSC